MSASGELLLSARDEARERLLERIESGAARCGVIGLGFIGSVLMDALISSGLEAHGYDRAARAVDRFQRDNTLKHSAPRRAFSVENREEAVLHCDVIFVAVRNPVDNGVIDEEPLRAAASVLRRQQRRARLVILESTVTPGCTRRFAADIGADNDDELFVAHAPERLSAGQDYRVLRSTPHLVGGLDPESTQLGTAVLRRICDSVVPVSAPEVSELSKLLENAYLSVNIGLANEVTRLSVSLGIRAAEVCEAAATKPFGFTPFYPGAGVGGHCLPNDLQMLVEAARTRGWHPELLSAAVVVNDRAPSVVVDRLQGLLTQRHVPLAGSSVLLVGVGFKPGSPDITRSPAFDVVRTLRERGAASRYCDSQVPNFSVDAVDVPAVNAKSLEPNQFTAAIILAGDATVPVQTLLGSAGVVLDAGGSRRDKPFVVGIETL